MATSQVNPTRMELQRLREKLVTTARGHKLLKDKQDELIHQFIPLLHVYKPLRENVEKALSDALDLYLKARVKMSKEDINDHISNSVTKHTLNAKSDRVMGVLVPQLSAETQSSDLTYDLLTTTSSFDALISHIQGLFNDLIRLTSLEAQITILMREIEKSKRRVNAIENIVMKEMEEQIHMIRMKLTDLERSNTIRMMKSKEIVIEKKAKK